jgi:hypothetical protein
MDRFDRLFQLRRTPSALRAPIGDDELRIPCRDPREPVMDILRQGAEVDVISPEPMGSTVAAALRDAAAHDA